MGNIFRVAIAESLDQLKVCLQQQKTVKGRERIQMLYWLKMEPTMSRKSLALRLNRNESTVYRWLQSYKEGGIERLLEIKARSRRDPLRGAGPTFRLRGETLSSLRTRLNQVEGFRSYTQVQQWLEENSGLLIPYSTVHRTVRYRLKAKLKVPRPRSLQTDVAQQQSFKKNCQRSRQ